MTQRSARATPTFATDLSRQVAARLSIAAWCLVSALASGASGGCGGSGAQDPNAPQPALGSSTEAQTEMRSLLNRWTRGSRPERAALEPDFAAFRRHFPDDDLGRTAGALQAWAALERSDMRTGAPDPEALDRATSVARQVAAQAAGTTRDLAQTIEGAVLRRRGKPEEALAKLVPLVSKLIDDDARALLNEEIVASALAAKRWETAIQLMGVWLREAQTEGRGGVWTRIRRLLKQAPPEELSRILEQRLLAANRSTGEQPPDVVELHKLLAQQLAEIARERKDVELAQRLLATSGSLLGSQGEPVAQLAASSGRARVEAPTVGLLLSLRTDVIRRRGAEVAAGLMHGLGLPGSAARVVSRNDGGDPARIGEALSGLSSEGAAVLVAGVDEVEADAAATFAEAREIPVVLLRPPSKAVKPSGFVFVLGPRPADMQQALAAGLAERGATKIALITDTPGPTPGTGAAAAPSIVAIRPCSEVPDTAGLRALGVSGVITDGEAGCVHAVLAASAGIARLRRGFGLDAMTMALPDGSLVPSAGRYPIGAQAQGEPWLASWYAQRHAPPSFWAGLGRDAGVLAWAGVQALPTEGTEDPKEVLARRSTARQALAAATADLWTTEARGFDGGRVLPRRIGASELTKTALPKR